MGKVTVDLSPLKKLQEALNWIMCEISHIGPLPRVKKMLQLRGIDAGPPRLPNKPVTPEMEKVLSQALTGLFDHPVLGTYIKK